MGMYTDIFVNVDFVTETPQSVIDVISAICNKDFDADCLKDKPRRWVMLFNNGSYYSPSTECGNLTYDEISKGYSLIGKGDIKNYEGDIEAFFEFIAPYVENNFMGYEQYEECDSPTLIYKSDFIK
jgi:hypothetical protein